MNEDVKAELFRLKFRVKLLSDLHSGTGQGWLSLIDDCQARDRYGRPVIWGSTLFGRLRDVADQLLLLDNVLEGELFDISEDFVADLFGSEVSRRKRISVRSLHFEADASESSSELGNFITITSTSRELHGRGPMEGSLRTIEYARAGLIGNGEIRVWGTEKEISFVEQCLLRLSSLGGSVTRGKGRIRISDLRRDIVRSSDPTPQSPRADDVGVPVLRLVLRNLEPLLLNRSAVAGNDLESLSYLPGSSLRGAFFSAISEQGFSSPKIDAWVDDKSIHFSNGLPVATMSKAAKSEDLEKLASIPIPLSAREPKSSSLINESLVPWWCNRSTAAILGSDSLNPKNDSELNSYLHPMKRIKSEDYVATRNGQEWYRLGPMYTTILRNRVPVGRQDRTFDSRRPDAEGVDLTASELFSQTCLSEDQLWLVDIQFSNLQVAHEFCDAIGLVVAGEEDDRHWLRVGRGGHPVVVTEYCWVSANSEVHSHPLGDSTLDIVLTSDLIARDKWLRYFTELDLACLNALLEIPKQILEQINIVRELSVSEHKIVRSFRSGAGVRASDELAIRKGSVLRITSHSSEAIGWIREALQGKMQPGLGFRTEEGFGRFILNCSAHYSGWSCEEIDIAEGLSREEQERLSAREEVLSKVLSFNVSASSPGRSQWQGLRHAVESISVNDSHLSARLSDLLDNFELHSETIGGQLWKPWLPAIRDVLESWRDSPILQREFLIFLGRNRAFWDLQTEAKALNASEEASS